mmetsp:Transcript_42957/g.101388  ORF Transcript_42957/g.101388 Transcript_42957/m.101388 type:complete len:683 (+) Transcript_42957:337-2385(+)
MLNKFRGKDGEKYNFTITVHSLRLSSSMPWHSTKTWYHDKARECAELPEWCSQVGIVWKRGNKDARTRWESALKIDADDPVKLELITWDQSLSLPFTVYPKGNSQFKEKMCSIQLYARTGHSSDAVGKKLASCKVDLGSVVPSKTVDLELLMDSKPLGLLRLSFTAKSVENGSPASPAHSTQRPFAQNKAFSSSFSGSGIDRSDVRRASEYSTPPNPTNDRVINNGRKGGMLRQVASWSGGKKVPDSIKSISRDITPEGSDDSQDEAEVASLPLPVSRQSSRDNMTPTPSLGRTPTKQPNGAGALNRSGSVSRSAPVSPRGTGLERWGHERIGSGSFTPSTDYQVPKYRTSADYAEKRVSSADAESLTPLRGWSYSHVGSKSFSGTPVTRSAAGSRSGSRAGSRAASPGPRGSRAASPSRGLGIVEEPQEEDLDVTTPVAEAGGGHDRGDVHESPKRLLEAPPGPNVGRSQSDYGESSVHSRKSGDIPRKSVDVAARSIFTSIGDTFSSSFSVLGLGGTRRASVAEGSKQKEDKEKEDKEKRDKEREKDEAMQAEAAGTPLFAKSNSELLKEVFALRREVAAKQVAMEERDREIAELRGSEADLKLRLVRAEASRKLPSAHNTNTNTQKLIAEEAERLTSVYVPILRDLTDEVESLKVQLAESRAELSLCHGSKNGKSMKRR